MTIKQAAALLLFSFFTVLAIGEIPLPDLIAHAKERLFGSETGWNALLDERLPRALLLITTGASLAVSGAVMQSLFHNPLASPGTLGITSGGSLFVILSFATGVHSLSLFALPLAAIAGCLATLLLVWRLASRNGETVIYHLLLTGIATTTLFVAFQGAVTYLLRDDWTLVQTITEWQAGSTFNRSWRDLHIQLPLAIVGFAIIFSYLRELDILALGDEEAKNLGVDIRPVRFRLFLAVALLSGGALAAVGVVAFFGLLLPHMVRMLTGSTHRKVIPLSLLLGGSFLALLDALLRFFHLHFLTIGTLSALLGGLFFFFLLGKELRRAHA